MRLAVYWRDEGGIRLPMACWRPGPGYRMISSGVLGGGIGPREWVLNAQVASQYARTDPAGHLTELAAQLGLTGPGTGMLTAAQVTDLVTRADEGAEAAVTTGLRVPTWAAAPAAAADPELAPGTINIIVSVPVPLTDAALVNAVITATEAKTQAVLDAGFPGTGTATDAVCVAAPASPGAAAEDFAGPRSAWGARIARAVHAAVLAGATGYRPSRLPAVAHRRPRPAGSGLAAPNRLRALRSRHRLRAEEGDPMDDNRQLQVSRIIDAPPGRIFAALADPARHRELDGAGMVRGLDSGDAPVTAVGQAFVMNMNQDGIGDYLMRSEIVVYEADRRIGWAPAIHPPGALAHIIGELDPSGHTWIWELEPAGDGRTKVTHTYDWSGVRDQNALGLYPRVSQEQLEDSLDRVAAAVA